jgi:pyruvate kinase
MRRTRILATLGPASRDAATIRALLDAGADAFRLNFSHGSIPEHIETAGRIRAAARERGRHVGILQDLGGPKIRIGALAAPIELTEGESLVIGLGHAPGQKGRVACSFEALFSSVVPGQRLLVDDGRIELEVTDVSPGALTTRVMAGGPLESHKGINVPGVPLRTSALTAKDEADLAAGIAMGVEWVAHSFVQSADDVRRARAVAAAAGAPDLPIIAKIEKPQAVEHIDDIVQVADGLMIARGDLGIEVPLETLPGVQRRLVLTARRAGVPVILATQVLESMRTELRPTRAEVTDAAHAVDEGVDAIMLSGETAVGRHPARVVATLDAIVREAERELSGSSNFEVRRSNFHMDAPHGRALCEAAVTLATESGAAAIVAVTSAGHTARMLASLRPAAAILAATSNVHTAGRLSLVWGVAAIVMEATRLETVRAALLERKLVLAGSTVVFVSIHPALGQDGTNFVRVEKI